MKKRILSIIIAIALTVVVFTLPIINPGADSIQNNSGKINRAGNIVNNNIKKDEKTQEKTTIPKSDTTVTFLITVDSDSLYDSVKRSVGKYKTVYDLLKSDDYRKYTDAVRKSQAIVKASIEKVIDGSDFKNCYSYNTVINGFSVKAPYSALDKLKKISGVQSVNPVFTNYLTISEADEDNDYDYYSDNNDYTDDYTDDNTDDYTDDYTDNYTDDTDNDSDDDYYNDDYSEDEYSEETGNNDSDESDNSEEESSVENEENSESSDENAGEYSAPFHKMTQTDAALKSGFTGNGKVIAVIDNAFDCSEKLFSTMPVSKKLSSGDIKSVTDRAALNTKDNSSLSKNDKIIFAYDYAGFDSDTFSENSDHGTKTAALAAGNDESSDGNSFVGMAPDSQLILMKVCPDNSNYAGDDVILAALDDIAKFCPDVLNISLGLPRSAPSCGLTEKAIEVISEEGTIICSSAGNNAQNTNSGLENGLDAKYTDYSTISYPSSMSCVISAASVDSDSAVYDYIEIENGTKFPIADIICDDSEDTPDFSEINEQIPYIYFDGFGEAKDYDSSNIYGKIAVVKRGGIPITDKIRNASFAGAAGILIISDEPLYIRFKTEYKGIPCAVLDSSALSFFSQMVPAGNLSFRTNGSFDISTGSQPSSFTSYGVTSNLKLKPDISAPGTDIIIPAGETNKRFNGTSASSAVISGAASVMCQYFSDSDADFGDTPVSSVISAIMMNTAVPTQYEKGLYYTPRLQGSGILNIKNAVNTPAYVTDESGLAAVSAGDNKDGKFTFSLTLHNFSDQKQDYKLSYSSQSDKLESRNNKLYNTLKPESLTSKTTMTFRQNGKEITEISAKPDESIVIECTLELDPELVIYYEQSAGCGMYIDGYVFFTPVNNDICTLSVPYTGYCGSWEQSELFDADIYQSIIEPALGASSLVACSTDSNSIKSAVLGKNLFTGKCNSQKIFIGRDTVKNIYDLSYNSSSFIIPDIYLLRDGADFTINIKDSSGKTIYDQNIGNVSSFADAEREPFTALLNSFNSDSLRNLFSELPEGNYSYTVSASTIASDSGKGDVQHVSYDFTVDNSLPEAPKTEIFSKDNKVYLRLKASDDKAMHGFVLYTANDFNNMLSYSDRLDVLIENNYISEDSYKMISSEFNGSSAEFVYDITQLYSSLLSLKSFAEKNDMNVPIPTKIFARSADAAFNLSSPVECRTVVPGKVSYNFKDQDGDPVEGVCMTLDGQTEVSDNNGNIVFTNIIPDIYAASVTDLPDDYKTDKTVFLVDISNSKYEISENISVTFTGTKKAADEDSEDESSVSETELAAAQIQNNDNDSNSFDVDDSTFAIVFIGSMLLVSTISLILSKRNRIYNYDHVQEDDFDDDSGQDNNDL